MSRRYDLAIVGGGTAGLVTAVGAAQLGARVCLVEEERTGGECLWTGCVPSKTLLAAAGLAQRMRTADAVGLSPTDPAIDFPSLMAHVRGVQQRIAPNDSPERLRSEGVEVIETRARFEDPRHLRAGGRTVAFRNALVATGARPAVPGLPGLAEAGPLTSDTVWGLAKLPPRLAVLGGGPVGVELGQAFARLGAAVTLVEMAPTLLPKEEPETAALVADRLRAEGVRVLPASRVTRAEPGDGATRLLIEGGSATEAVEVDRVLAATGNWPQTGELGLEAAGVATTESGAVAVDERLRTTTPNIYAAGDVTMRLPFTHMAAHQARTVIANALFHLRRRVVDPATVPWVTFTDPEVARVGLSEAQAREHWGERAVVRTFQHTDLDRAQCSGEPAGFSKLVADDRARLVGATVVGPSAGEVLAELASLVSRRAGLAELSGTVHAYPTFAEAPVRAADEHLRDTWLTPRTRRVARPVLGLLRLLER